MTGYSVYRLDPGPLEPSVLTQQLTHRSRDIWNGSVNMILNTRSLITSLVERWRPETHTFHFRTGEATITLQDVEVLYGLPVNGDPVLGDESIRTIGDWQNICQRLLGFIPRPQDFNRSSLKVTALNAHMLEQLQLPDLTTQEMIDQMARCYMFWMIAGMMMADTSGNYLKLMCLPMLEDLNVVSSYSWGSATLACLYRFLCKASQSNQNEIAGFLPLLQFIWEPYSDDLIESLPDYCRIG
ncbi:protein MAIN-LIKE 1-like [Solanum lycopersicum]|uniref:protein MAIN-LIKE 1-like n=1 Tax=Solanum lycopersicum TaxID=4081 RepID=UPI00374883AB